MARRTELIRSCVRSVDWQSPDGRPVANDKRPGSPAAVLVVTRLREGRRARACVGWDGDESVADRARGCRARPVFYCWRCCGCRHCCRQLGAVNDLSLTAGLHLSSSLFHTTPAILPAPPSRQEIFVTTRSAAITIIIILLGFHALKQLLSQLAELFI